MTEKDLYQGKAAPAQEALRRVVSGQHVLVGSGAAQPQALVRALAERGKDLDDIEVLHLLTLGAAPYAQPQFEGRIRHNALFIGPNVRQAVSQGLADYTPCLLSEVPGLLRSGRLPVDVALIQVTPPENGVCSLGVSVDVLRAAVESASCVIAQVNPRMPWTHGDSFLRLEDIDVLVPAEESLPELPRSEPTAVALWIGRYVSRLVADGAVLQIGIGAIPDAVLAALSGKKDLGLHSEMVSDGILPLLKDGALTGARKTLHPGKMVVSFCMGTRELYAAVDRNAAFEFRPSDYVNDADVIARNEGMVAVNSALQVDLTGQVVSDSLDGRFYGGFGGQLDFIRGARRSKGGRSIIALPSTAKAGSASRIVSTLSPGTGVVTTRADVDFVVSEYGIASLKGKTIRERAVALISIAHPDFRKTLYEEAKKIGYLDAGHVLPLEAGAYLAELETRADFGGREVFFRPLKPSDERHLKDLFYSQSPETTYLRFGAALKRLSERQFQELVAIDARSSMAVGGFVREGSRERLIAVGRYGCAPPDRLAEAAFTVRDDWQGKGIGSFLLDYLAWIAIEQGLEGFIAEITVSNPGMERLFYKRFRNTAASPNLRGGASIRLLFKDWKGSGNPILPVTPTSRF